MQTSDLNSVLCFTEAAMTGNGRLIIRRDSGLLIKR